MYPSSLDGSGVRPRFPVTAFTATFESAPSVFCASRTLLKFSTLCAIFALHVCLTELKRLDAELLFCSIRSAYAWPPTHLTMPHIRSVHCFSKQLPSPTLLHTSEQLQLISIYPSMLLDSFFVTTFNLITFNLVVWHLFCWHHSFQFIR